MKPIDVKTRGRINLDTSVSRTITIICQIGLALKPLIILASNNQYLASNDEIKVSNG